MGLDMYLDKKTYIGANYDHNKVTGSINIKKDGKLVNINMSRVTEITERIGYWRKANHIHKWFVDNVQDGVDNCGEYNVSKARLTNLLHLCKNVFANRNKEISAEALPTESGFFFGVTEIDEYYYSACEDTIEIIENILKEWDNECEIYYHSSW